MLRPHPEQAQRQHAEMIDVFHTVQNTTYKDYGLAGRGVDAEGHKLLTGTLQILAPPPASLAQGLCDQPGTHDVVLRLSTKPGDMDDSVSTPPGLAIKVSGLERDRLRVRSLERDADPDRRDASQNVEVVRTAACDLLALSHR